MGVAEVSGKWPRQAISRDLIARALRAGKRPEEQADNDREAVHGRAGRNIGQAYLAGKGLFLHGEAVGLGDGMMFGLGRVDPGPDMRRLGLGVRLDVFVIQCAQGAGLAVSDKDDLHCRRPGRGMSGRRQNRLGLLVGTFPPFHQIGAQLGQ